MKHNFELFVLVIDQPIHKHIVLRTVMNRTKIPLPTLPTPPPVPPSTTYGSISIHPTTRHCAHDSLAASPNDSSHSTSRATDPKLSPLAALQRQRALRGWSL
jgi:hypothetical protein